MSNFVIPPLNEIADLTCVEGGKEYDLRIRKVKPTKSNRTGRPGLLCIIDFIDEDNAAPIMHTLWFGNVPGTFSGDDEEKSEQMWRSVKDECRALGLDPDNGITAEDLEDLTFTALVDYDDGIVEKDDGTQTQEYAPKNVIGRITGL